MDDQDSITLLDADGAVILQFYRHSGRREVYVQSPLVPSTSLLPERATDLAAFILETLCNCTAIRSALGEARPEHKIGGHEPDCVATNAIMRAMPPSSVR